MGVSRRETVVCAYIVATKRMKGHEAIAYVQERRSIVCPNLGFRHQLDIYAEKFGGPSTERKPLSFFKYPRRLVKYFKMDVQSETKDAKKEESEAVQNRISVRNIQWEAPKGP